MSREMERVWNGFFGVLWHRQICPKPQMSMEWAVALEGGEKMPEKGENPFSNARYFCAIFLAFGGLLFAGAVLY